MVGDILQYDNDTEEFFCEDCEKEIFPYDAFKGKDNNWRCDSCSTSYIKSASLEVEE